MVIKEYIQNGSAGYWSHQRHN